jgi:hypothetical protein
LKIIRKRGDTSNILQVFVRDSSSTIGAGLTGLVFNSASLTAYYHRDVDTTATAISLVTMTVGTFTSSGFKEIDATNMPGWYQFCPPDTAFASTSTPKSVAFHLKGATNMASLPIECQLIAADVEDAAALGLSRIDAAITTRLAPTVAARTLDVSAGGEAGIDLANVGSPTTTLNLSGTTISTSQAVASVSGAVGSVTGNVGGSVASVTADVGITQAAADKVWSTTTRALTDKVGFALSAAGVQAIWDALTSALTTVGSIGKLLVDNINATISSRLASASYTAPDNATVSLIYGVVDTEVAAIKAKTDQLTFTTSNRVDSTPIALGTQAKADVNAEVVDALSVDTYAESSSVPAATASLKDMLHWIFSATRNKRTTTSSADVVRNDGDTAAIGTSTISDDGTTFTRGKYS